MSGKEKEDESLPNAEETATPMPTVQEDSDQEDTVEFEEDKSSSLRQRTNEMREKMKLLLDQFDEEQLKRYEVYRRSGFPRAVMKKTIQTILGQSTVNQNMIIVICGVAKVFVGEVVEEAKRVMKDWGGGVGEAEEDPDAPILPSHLREAYRRLQKKGIAPSSSQSFVNRRNLCR